MSNLLNILKSVNASYASAKFYKRFTIDGTPVGLVKPEVSVHLSKHPDVFEVTPSAVTFHRDLNSYETRSEAMETSLKRFKNDGLFSTLKGWRNECYDVKGSFDGEPFFKMDRSATCLFGIRNYGISVSGYVEHPSRGLCLWLQKRSATKQRWPGVWDNMVGGGISVGQGILETVRKESKEEASLSESVLKDIVSVGALSCFYVSDEGIFPNYAFVFDVQLPRDYVPKNADGEVDFFRLVPVGECLEIIEGGRFKKPVIMVLIDFLIRHSVITPYGNPYYVGIAEMLHVDLQRLYEINSK